MTVRSIRLLKVSIFDKSDLPCFLSTVISLEQNSWETIHEALSRTLRSISDNSQRDFAVKYEILDATKHNLCGVFILVVSKDVVLSEHIAISLHENGQL